MSNDIEFKNNSMSILLFLNNVSIVEVSIYTFKGELVNSIVLGKLHAGVNCLNVPMFHVRGNRFKISVPVVVVLKAEGKIIYNKKNFCISKSILIYDYTLESVNN